MKGFIKYLYLLLVLSGCGQLSNKENRNLLFEDCISQELNKTIKNYIFEIIPKLPESKNFYFSTYFFQENNNNYFTIWVFNCFPNYIKDYNKDKVLEFYLFEIAEHSVILIADKNMPARNLPFIRCAKNGELATNEVTNTNKPLMTYDGSWLPKTYRYQINGEEIQIKEIETPKVSFLGDGYSKFENSLKR